VIIFSSFPKKKIKIGSPGILETLERDALRTGFSLPIYTIEKKI
jgi:hypothetical protein